LPGGVAALAPDGTILLGRRTDYVQVDTNSEVEDGKGLLFALSHAARSRAIESVSARVRTGPRENGEELREVMKKILAASVLGGDVRSDVNFPLVLVVADLHL